MPNLMDATAPYPTVPTRAWSDRVSGWIRAATGATDPTDAEDSAIDAFADLLVHARDLAEVRVTLVRLAGRATGATRVELFRGPRDADRSLGPLAAWPSPTGTDPSPTDDLLRLDLRTGGHVLATLQVTPASDRPWTARSIRALETLCAMAAGAERCLGQTVETEPSPLAWAESPAMLVADPTPDAFLRFALAQARRRNEPLSVFDVSVDRLAAIREVLGQSVADAAVHQVARTIQETLRASDVVTRVSHGGLLAILPAASAANAARVAEVVRAAIAESGRASEVMPILTATIGVASYPDHAAEATELRTAAARARHQAESQGHDRVVALPPAISLAG